MKKLVLTALFAAAMCNNVVVAEEAAGTWSEKFVTFADKAKTTLTNKWVLGTAICAASVYAVFKCPWIQEKINCCKKANTPAIKLDSRVTANANAK